MFIDNIFNLLPNFSFYNKIQILLIVISCFKIQFAEDGKFFDSFSFQQTKNIRGILSILVFLTHFDGTKMNKKSYYYLPNLSYGYICIGFLFFYSGYSLMKQYLTKNNYWKGFLRKRLIRVLIPFYIVNTFCVLLFYYTGEKYYSSKFPIRQYEKNSKIIFQNFLGIIPAYDIGWYVIIISILYILFYFCFKFIKYHQISIGIIFFFQVYTLYYGSMKKNGFYWFEQLIWNQSTFSFVLGLIICKYEKKIVQFIQKSYNIFLLLFLSIYFYINNYCSLYENYINKQIKNIGNQYLYIKIGIESNIICIMDIIIVHTILMKITLNNKILNFLGNISGDIFFYHKFGWKILRSDLIYIRSDRKYMIMCCAWAIIIPIFMGYINSFFVNLFLKITFGISNCLKEKEKQLESQKNINIKEKDNLQSQKISEEMKENVYLKYDNNYQNIPELDNSPKQKNLKSERNYGIDLLRIVSMFMIIVRHILRMGGILSGCKRYSFSYYIACFLDSIIFSCVNIFGLISGYVMVNLKIDQTKIIILWLNVFYYSTIITLLYKYFPSLSKNKQVSNFEMVISIMFPISSKRYWYFSCYFGMYFFIPFMNKFISSLQPKEMKNLCLTIIIIFTIVNRFAPKNFDPFSLANGFSSIWLICLYFIGAYLKLYPIKLSKKVLLLLYLSSIIIPWMFKLKFISEFVLKYYYYDDLFLQYNSPFILLNSTILILLFSNLKIKNWLFKTFIEITGQLCFNVYLIHTNKFVFESHKNYFLFLVEKKTYIMVLMVFTYSLGILFSCLIIDLIRFYLFQLFKVHEIAIKLKKIIKK